MDGQSRKKVIIFITKSNWGGAQKYVFDIAANLPKDQFEVAVALGGNGLLHTRLVEAGIRVIELKDLGRDVSISKDIKIFFEIYKILQHEKPHIIHVNSSKISGIGAVAGRLTGVKNIIFTIHGWAFNEPRGIVSKTFIKFLYLIMLWLSHTVIAVSNKIVDQVRDWPFNKKKITVIHNGIRTPNFLDKKTAREKLGTTVHQTFTEATLICGSIGELHPIKGHTYAIQAIQKLILANPELRLAYIIIGGGEIETKLQDEIKMRGVANHVFLTGYMQDASTYLKAFDYYLFPSISEGLPYAVVEAGFAELPTIASNVGGIPEIITHSVEGKLVPPQSPDSIAAVLSAYFEKPEEGKQHAVQLHAKVTTEFSIDTMVKKTIETYHR